MGWDLALAAADPLPGVPDRRSGSWPPPPASSPTLLGLEDFLVPSPAEIAEAALGQPLAAGRKRLGDAAGDPARLRLRGRDRHRLRDRDAPLGPRPALDLPAGDRLADDPDRRRRPDPGPLVRFRDLSRRSSSSPSSASSRSPSQPSTGSRLARPRGAQDDAHPRCLALADLPAAGSPDRPAVCSSPGSRSPSSFAPIGAVFGEWVGASSGPRPPDPPGQRPTGDRAAVRRSGGSLGDRRSRSSVCTALAERRVVTWR